MKFGYTIVYVASVAETLAFYQQAFGFDTRFLHESGEYGELETGGTALAFASHGMGDQLLGGRYVKAAPAADPLGIELAFVSDDVVAAHARAVAAGATSVAVPAVQPWGQTVAYVRDMNGVLVELCSPIGG
ncbi:MULTISPECIES: VOC family protein [Microvirgula]|uniref:Glyoxalase n=1 Tax=Microvirgula aerodenitrificans TaxID=57480 RepID=A0A2S0PAK7_9NEIS|nr:MULTISPECIES: VOC family protein [Microvirgula]AVY94375.1 glyoxalase [Microvirgula aerodenitrificans]RAS19209.1 putative glyoxalase superfamily protein PhnB [Microvirgula sp. AG722]